MQRFIQYIVFVSILLSSLQAFAQTDQQKIDALLRKAQTINSNEEKIKVFCQLAYTLSEIDAPKGLEYATQALQIANQYPQSEIQIQALVCIAHIAWENGKVEEARKYADNAATAIKNSDNKALQIDVLNLSARLDLKQNRTRANQALSQALSITEGFTYKKGQAQTYELLGDWALAENPSEAINHYQRAYNLYRAENLQEQRIAMLQKTAKAHALYRNDYPNALRNLQEALKISETLKNQRILSENLNQIGNIHFLYLQDYKTAVKYYLQSFVLTQEYDFPNNGNTLAEAIKGIAECYNSLANLSRRQGYDTKADEFEKLYATYQQTYKELDNLQRDVMAFKKQQTVQAVRRYTAPSPNLNNTSSEERNNLKKELERKAENIDQLARENKISPLKKAELKADILLEEDNLNIGLGTVDENMATVSSKMPNPNNKSTQSGQTQKNIKNKSNNTFNNLYSLAFLLFAGLVIAVLLYLVNDKNRKIIQQKKEQEEQAKLKSQEINQQKVTIRQHTQDIDEYKNKLEAAKLAIEDAKLDNVLLVDLLNREIVPPLQLLFSESSENRFSPEVQQHGQAIINLLRGIHSVEKKDALTLQIDSCNLYKISRRALQRCQALMSEKNIQLNNQIKPYFSVEADDFYVEEIFANLFYNSLKYAPQGSTIYLESELTRQDGKKWIQTIYSDQGKGLSINNPAAVFEKYKSEETRALAHSFPYIYKIVESHGGKAEIQPEHKDGLIFKFTLPYTPESEI